MNPRTYPPPTRTIAIGDQSQATGTYCAALGNQVQNTQDNSIRLGPQLNIYRMGASSAEIARVRPALLEALNDPGWRALPDFPKMEAWILTFLE